MLTMQSLRSHPTRLRALTGLTVAQYDQLLTDLTPRYDRAEAVRLARPNRQRRRGGGRKFCRPLADRLLLALVWLRIYPTYEVLGTLFDVDKGTVCHWLHPLLALVRETTAVDLHWPEPDQKKRDLGDLLRDFPETAAIIDATEQRIRRPKDPKGTPPAEQGAAQRPYYSGKKKAHVLKTQIAITPEGQIADVRDTVPGAVNDLTLLRQSSTLDRVPGGKGSRLDSGDQGIQKDRPSQLLYQAYRASRGHPLTPEQKAANRVLGHYRVKIEHTLAEMKIYQVLAAVYRHGRGAYNPVFCVVAALTNRRRGFQPAVAS
jgi:hypothetical protein